MSDALTPPIVTSIIAKLMIKQQGDNVIHTKIKEDVLTLQTNLQQVLYSTLSKRAVANKGERTQIFKIFEFMIDDGCSCESEFREMCKNSRIKSTPALKEIVERISESHQEFKNLLS